MLSESVWKTRLRQLLTGRTRASRSNRSTVPPHCRSHCDEVGAGDAASNRDEVGDGAIDDGIREAVPGAGAGN